MAQAAPDCPAPLGRLVSLQGSGQGQHAVGASRGRGLCPGDEIRVPKHTRAALVLANQTTVRLDQETTLIVRDTGAGGATLLELVRGAIHVITRTPQPFKVNTPFVNAGVQGTEFVMQVGADRAQVAALEGAVDLSSAHGPLHLVAGELALVAANQAPTKQTTLRPADAVQWALYYPAVIDYRLRGEAAATAGLPAEALELYRQGQLAQAIFLTDQAPERQSDPHFLLFRASLLLAVGQAEEARPELARALALDPHNSDAQALAAIIAVARNDKAEALTLADKAVETGPGSPAAHMARSYAQQAHFRIDEATASVRKALELQPKSALAWARLAELQLAAADRDGALASAKNATALEPDLSKTQMVLGFAHLTRSQTGAAKEAFGKAIALDQEEPTARLGLGLAQIREGHLKAGREEIEIAASLDPANALIRSYLGKAYAEEKRPKLAGAQFDLAKAMDPKDPTPWFYDALGKQADNRPVEALESLEKSVELNDKRAVYRSRLLLDDDRAARAASASRSYLLLGLDDLARIEAADAIALDPSNHSAHRFLADALARLPDQQSTSISELLQAQLLQPVNLSPVRPSQLVPEFSLPQSAGLLVAGYNEYSPLFERDGPRATISAMAGNRGTFGDEVTLSGVAGAFSYSLGQFRYESDGFRKNNDVRHDVVNALAQYQISPALSVQAEVRSRETQSGDLTLTSNPNLYNFTSVDRWRTDKDSGRIGLRYAPSPENTLLVSVQQAVRTDRLLEGVFPDGTPLQSLDKQHATRAEVQLQHRTERLSLVGGVEAFRSSGPNKTRLFDPELQALLQFDDPNACPSLPCEFADRTAARQRAAYLYANVRPTRDFLVTLGLSNTHDRFAVGETETVRERWSPKLGVIWKPAGGVRLRAAAFRSVRPSLTVEERLEPSQVAGFSQNIDGAPGSRSEFGGIGIDFSPGGGVHFGLEGSRRWTFVDVVDVETGSIAERAAPNKAVSAFVGWTPTPRWALSLKAERNLIRTPLEDSDTAPIAIAQTVVPLQVRHFGNGFFASMGVSSVRQTVQRAAGSPYGDQRERFTLVDAQVGFQLPNRWGVISLEGRNLLDEKFTFLYSPLLPDTETRLLRDARFSALGRQILLRLNLAF
ncbi:MAG: TonB-dependent receptor [Rhodocyclaceae bacterium]